VLRTPVISFPAIDGIGRMGHTPAFTALQGGWKATVVSQFRF